MFYRAGSFRDGLKCRILAMPLLEAVDGGVIPNVGFTLSSNSVENGKRSINQPFSALDVGNKNLEEYKGEYSSVKFRIDTDRQASSSWPSLLIDLNCLPANVNSLSVNTLGYVNLDFRATNRSLSVEQIDMRKLYEPKLENLLRSVPFTTLNISDSILATNSLAEEIWGENLQALRFCDTYFQFLPAGMERSQNLENLEITRSGLRELPAIAGQMPSLRLISCDGNYLSDLPVLDKFALRGSFRNNRFRHIPEWVAESGLYVNLHGNPIADGGWRHGMASGRDFHLAGADGEVRGRIDFSRNLIRCVPPWLPMKRLADEKGETNNQYEDAFGSKVAAVSFSP